MHDEQTSIDQPPLSFLITYSKEKKKSDQQNIIKLCNTFRKKKINKLGTKGSPICRLA